jgi:hypothetical protein
VAAGQWDGLLWLILTLVPFILVQRWLHRELQGVFLLTTRHPTAAILLFQVVFLPGVFLHEMSHFVTAKLLRVRTGRFSLLPQLMGNGLLRMGFVEIGQTDYLRDSLIGAAPLISGGLAVGALGIYKLGVLPLMEYLQQQNLPGLFDALWSLPKQPDFWLWFYLAFVVSSMMMPSASDRSRWSVLVLVVAVLAGLAFLAGLGPWLAQHFAPGLNSTLNSIALVFGISLVVHFILAVPLMLIRKLLSRITGLTYR